MRMTEIICIFYTERRFKQRTQRVLDEGSRFWDGFISWMCNLHTEIYCSKVSGLEIRSLRIHILRFLLWMTVLQVLLMWNLQLNWFTILVPSVKREIYSCISLLQTIVKSLRASQIWKSLRHGSSRFINEKFTGLKNRGMNWGIKSNQFHFQVVVQDRSVTQRGSLSTVASVFDPIA